MLRDFKDTLTAEERLEFKATTLRELELTIVAIQKKQATTKRMQNMTRIRGFLEAMESYGKVVEIFVNASEFVAFIWVSPPQGHLLKLET